ncbi:glycosyltransferase [Lentzea sp. CC55]|uniref:glycosyltransferase n=1 Tax=Lentzea sp. CC55 TaxID=2884909 RepID=UPI0023D8EB20|nr:glycosyltransferase [Lentzea sp. CC55]
MATAIDAGPPPAYIGFGSMAGRDAERTGEVVAQAARAAGVRAVIATGWGGLAAHTSADLHVIDQAPHDWLFPKMSAVVHHGGGGTTPAALAAGVPQVVCPFVADQPHWAQRMHAVGVAPRPIPHRALTVSALADAISHAVDDAALRHRAGELGEQIRSENGVATAVRELERCTAPEVQAEKRKCWPRKAQGRHSISALAPAQPRSIDRTSPSLSICA